MALRDSYLPAHQCHEREPEKEKQQSGDAVLNADDFVVVAKIFSAENSSHVRDELMTSCRPTCVCRGSILSMLAPHSLLLLKSNGLIAFD